MKTRTLLLTSAGMEVKEEILKILPKAPGKIKLAHIITAAKAEKYIEYLDEDRQKMIDLGIGVENIDIAGKNEDEVRELLKDKDVIYVQGGNTFFLLKYVRESGFDKVVKELVGKGAIYIGVSAGSILAGPTIETTGWKNLDRNIVGLTDLTALNFVPFLIFPHYKPRYRALLEKEAPRAKYPVRILTDKQAFFVKDDETKLVGKGKEIKIL
ncbi:MAG: Type 1 glutamine amidotransferase-like domain-containing protein [bacterium]|nr:Type 1 glutamine amidotransferase-like domain-containing protein [bacterium]